MNQISINDTWTHSEKLRHRDRLAIKYLKGQGIEIGALHKPTQVSSDASVKYVDYKTRLENFKQYPELQNSSIVETDITDEAFVLSKVDSGSQNFIIANQVLEHSPNPIGTLEMWIQKLHRGGYLLLSVPIADCCFDKGRPITSLEHMIKDYQLFASCNIQKIVNVTRYHLQEFIQVSGLNIRKKAGLPPATAEEQQLFLEKLMSNFSKAMYDTKTYDEIMDVHVKYINLKYDVHYHTFSATSFLEFSKYCAESNSCCLEDITKSGGGEVIAVIKKN